MIRIIPIAVAIVATGALTGVAAAAEPLKEVTVQAARVVEVPVGRTESHIPVVNASLSYGVSYADLDLTLPSGVKTLEKRVNDLALKACEQLHALYPVTVKPAPSDEDCAKAAADKALATVIHK
jgi:UrcA family protein